MNVKTAYHGQQTLDEKRKPVRKENLDEVTNYLTEFSLWLKKWQEGPNMKVLSKPTFKAAIQTSGSFPLLLKYMLSFLKGRF